MSDYENSINALIPAAKKEATQKVAALGKKSEERTFGSGKTKETFTWDFWTEYFHSAMNRMAIEAGLRH